MYFLYWVDHSFSKQINCLRSFVTLIERNDEIMSNKAIQCQFNSKNIYLFVLSILYQTYNFLLFVFLVYLGRSQRRYMLQVWRRCEGHQF